MIRRISRFAALSLVGFVCALASRPVGAALIMYEGFAGYTAGSTLTGQAVSGSTVGLDTSTSWQSNNAILWNVESTGLTLGSGATILQTSGGAVRHTAGSSVVAAKLGLSPYIGTLYSSQLVSIDLSTAAANGVAFTVIGETTANTPARRFRSLARNASTAASPVGVNYTNGATAGTGEIPSNTAMMILSRFTRVGETVDANTPGEATLFALSSAQFDHFKSIGFAGIDAAVVGSGSMDVTGTATHTYAPAVADLRALNDTFYLQVASAISTAADVTFDEIRMGDSFDAVTPVVPEPNAILLAGIALASCGIVVRKRLRKQNQSVPRGSFH